MGGLRLGLAAATIAMIATGASARETPITILKIDNSYDVHRDGTFEQTYSIVFHVTNDAAAQHEAEQAISYVPSVEDFKIVSAATIKPDGRVIPVTADGLHDQLAPGATDLSLLTDERQKVVVFPDVGGGDDLTYTWHRVRNRPVFPGEFTMSHYLARTTPLETMTITVRAPEDMPLRTEAYGFDHIEATQDGFTTQKWTARETQIKSGSPVLGPFDRLPRVFVSTFPDYAAFGAAYAALVQPHMAVTPGIAALAETIAAGNSDREEQARRVYDWVSRHIRYVAVYLANGALKPHDAADVLAAGYGDCKDHVMLFHALLSALGINAQLVMVNIGDHYSLSGPPTFAQLNHAISFLPEFGVYADSTAYGTPFGTLPFSEYGKQAVYARLDGGERGRLPVLPPGSATAELHTAARLEANGAIVGTTETTATGPFAYDLRRMANWAETVGDADAAAQQLRALGTDGTGLLTYAPPETMGLDYQVSGSFVLDEREDLLQGDSFLLPDGLRLLPRVGDVLLGPLGIKELSAQSATPCYAGTQTEDVTLELPPGRHIERVPLSLHIDNELLTYDADWAESRGTVSVHRSLTSKIAVPLCTGETRRTLAGAMAAIRHEQAQRIALTPAIQMAGQ